MGDRRAIARLFLDARGMWKSRRTLGTYLAMRDLTEIWREALKGPNP